MKLVKLFSIFTILLALSSIGSLTTGCGISGVTDEIVDTELTPDGDNASGGTTSGSTTGDSDDGNTTGDDSSSSDSSTSGGSDDSSTTGSSSDDSSSSSSGGSTGEENAIPGQASIPVILSYDIPSIDEADVYYATPTEDDVTADTGTEGAIENCDDDADGDNEECTVVMSTSEITEATAMLSPLPWRERTKERGIFKSLLASISTLFASQTAHADYATELSEICSREGVVCCQGAVQSDGSFECYNNFGDTTIYTYVVKANTDDTLLWSADPYIDTPNNHVKWHDGNDYDLTSANGNVYVVSDATDSSDNESLKMADDGTGVYRVSYDTTTYSYSAGDFVFDTEGLWEDFTGEDATQFDWDSTNSIFGFIGGENLYVKQMDSSGAIIDELDLDTGMQLTKIKYVNEALYYSVEESDTEDDAYIYYPLTSTRFEDFTKRDIQFIDYGTDLDFRGNALTHASTTSFDMSNGLLVALYQDERGNNIIRGVVISSSTRFGGRRPVSIVSGSTFNGIDIALYDSDGSTGKAVVLDNGNNMLWNVDIDSTASRITSRFDSSTNGVAIASGAVAMAFNSDNTRVYVIGSTEMNVLALRNSSGTVITPTLVATVNIAEATGLSSKSFASSLSPSSIMVENDTIFIGATGIKSALTIDIDDITEDTSGIQEDVATTTGGTTTGGTTSTTSGISITTSGGLTTSGGWMDRFRELGL